MQQYGLDRAQAVELQNHYRDLVLADPGGEPALHFEAARTRAQRGEFEDRRDLARLKAAPFIIVFDLDETLYSQYYDPTVAATCHDFEVIGEDGASRYVKLNPGWKTAIERVVGLGGAVVMFTANTDANGYQNAAVWMMDDHPILESDKISGFLTNAHLVQQEKSEGAGAADPRRGQPVQEPSKDLRIIDPSLRRVVLVDDNPARVFQHRNLRLFKKFDAHAYCTATDDALKAAYAVSLDRVVDEIEDSARYMKAEGGDFVGAYLPFTMLGQVAVMFVQDTMGKSRKAAIAYVREHPDLVDETF
jgi:hypothetical protein